MPTPVIRPPSFKFTIQAEHLTVTYHGNAVTVEVANEDVSSLLPLRQAVLPGGERWVSLKAAAAHRGSASTRWLRDLAPILPKTVCYKSGRWCLRLGELDRWIAENPELIERHLRRVRRGRSKPPNALT